MCAIGGGSIVKCGSQGERHPLTSQLACYTLEVRNTHWGLTDIRDLRRQIER